MQTFRTTYCYDSIGSFNVKLKGKLLAWIVRTFVNVDKLLKRKHKGQVSSLHIIELYRKLDNNFRRLFSVINFFTSSWSALSNIFWNLRSSILYNCVLVFALNFQLKNVVSFLENQTASGIFKEIFLTDDQI